MKSYLLFVLLSLPLVSSCKKEAEKAVDPVNTQSLEALEQAATSPKGFRAISALRTRCTSGEAAACLHLGRAMENYKAEGTERASAVRWYSKACKLGDGSGCLSAGHFNTFGLYGATIDQVAGVKLYESACRQKVSEGCLYGAYITILMHDGKGANEEKRLVEACKGKSPLACAFAGRVIGLRAKSVPEMERARGLLSKACNEKSAHGCAYLGEFLLKHKDMSVGSTPAQTFLERGCKGRIAEGCMGLASFFMEQAGSNKFTQIVVKHLTDACLYGALGACDTLGRLYYEGKFIPVSYTSALFFARRGCAGRFGKACMLSARIFRFGQGITPNFDASLRYLKEACSVKEWDACIEAGKLFLNSPKPYKNEKAAAELFENGCKNNHLPSCTEFAAYLEGKDMERARKLHDDTCTKGGLGSCNRLGAMLLANAAELKKNAKLARRIFEKTCKLKDGEGCFHLAMLYEKGVGVRANKGMLKKYLKESCHLKFADACGKLSFMQFSNKANLNTKQAGLMQKKMAEACENGSFHSCYYLGRLYERRSKGAEVDLDAVSRAEGLYTKACRGHVKEACAGLARLEKERTDRQKLKAGGGKKRKGG